MPCRGSHSKQEAEAGPGLAVVQAAQPLTLAAVGSAQAGLPCGLSQRPAQPSSRLLLTCDNRCLFSRGHLPRGLMFNSLQPWSCRRGRWVVRPQASAGPTAFCPFPRQEWALGLGEVRPPRVSWISGRDAQKQQVGPSCPPGGGGAWVAEWISFTKAHRSLDGADVGGPGGS